MTAVFWGLLVAVAGYEAAALWTARRGDTISERLRSLRGWSWWMRLLVDDLVVWLVWHLVLDPDLGAGWVDLGIVAAVSVLSVASWVKKGRGDE